MMAPERTAAIEPGLVKLAQRIKEEFEEVPGLQISVSEASRFWGLDETTCEWVLARLLAAGFLATSVDQRYRKA
jgi:hypothetical protein